MSIPFAHGIVAEAGGFSPPDIADLELWLDASDASTITESSGDVSQWDDKSAAGNVLVQATGTNQPVTGAINGNDSLLFDGTDDRVRDATGSITSPPGTLAVVFTPTSVAAGVASIVRLRSGTTPVLRITRDGDDIRGTEGTGGGSTNIDIANVLAVNETRWVILRARNSGDGTSNLLTDEGNSASASFAASISNIDDINVGANANGDSAFAGHIHEVIYYNRYLSDAERDQLDAYLDAKWTLS